MELCPGCPLGALRLLIFAFGTSSRYLVERRVDGKLYALKECNIAELEGPLRCAVRGTHLADAHWPAVCLGRLSPAQRAQQPLWQAHCLARRGEPSSPSRLAPPYSVRCAGRWL